MKAFQVTYSATSGNAIAFMDRDGVLNEDHGYVVEPKDFQWNPEAIEAISFLKQSGYLVAVVTNQSGIGRGLYQESQFLCLMDWMQDELRAHGTQLDACYYCPHHPTEGLGEFRRDCDCRKPKPGMIIEGLKDLKGNPDHCFLLGDKETDLVAAQRAGVKPVLYSGGSLLAEVRNAVLT